MLDPKVLLLRAGLVEEVFWNAIFYYVPPQHFRLAITGKEIDQQLFHK